MLSNLDLIPTLQTNELCFVKMGCIWSNFTFSGGWGKIKIKDQLSLKAETGAELKAESRDWGWAWQLVSNSNQKR